MSKYEITFNNISIPSKHVEAHTFDSSCSVYKFYSKDGAKLAMVNKESVACIVKLDDA